MDSLRRRTVEALAEGLLADAGVTALPVKPAKIAEFKGIEVNAKPPTMTGASGWLIRSGCAFAIVYATHIDSIGFQHFSIAHEIGHFTIDGHPEHVFRDGDIHTSHAGMGANDEIEREADYFAACLLMPKQLCKALVGSCQDGMAAVKHLANTCEASLPAAALRYAEIGGLPVGVIQCLDGKVEFCATYPLRQYVGWARTLPRGSKVPQGTVTDRMAADSEAIRRAEEDSDSAEPCDWFTGADQNVPLIEEVIGLGTFGRTLTILTLDPDYVENDDEIDDHWEEPHFQ